MDDLLLRLKKGKTDNSELNQLIIDYMPFIKKEIAKTPVFQMEFNDRLSIAMLAFMNCVRQYDETAGSFFSFTAICIRNRLIDEGKKLTRYNAMLIALDSSECNDTESAAVTTRSIQEYGREQERLALSEELDLLSISLMEFGLTFSKLADICPKQNRSRNQCMVIAHEIVSDHILKEQFIKSHRIPQAELAKRFKLSEKTIEKHRRYIVAIALILLGDYPGIQAFLPKGGS